MKQTGFSRRGAESSFVLSHPVDCCFSPTLALDEIWSTSQSLSDTLQPKSRLFIKSINWNLSQNVSCHPAGAQEPIGEESVVGAFSLRRLFFLFTSNSCLWSIGWEQWGETGHASALCQAAASYGCCIPGVGSFAPGGPGWILRNQPSLGMALL